MREQPATGRSGGRAVVLGTLLAALAIVLGVLLLVPRCSQEVQDAGSTLDRPAAVEEKASSAGP